MEKIKMSRSVLFTVLLLGFCHVLVAAKADNEERKTYIVHMAKSQMPPSFTDRTHWYDSSLKSVSGSAQMLYTYTNVVHGFSARLTEAEAESLESQPGILSVLPELKYELHTTRTPQFLGLDQNANLFPESDSASDVIVGVFDTGVWPESKSFDDTGLGPIPSSWKGQCESGNNFNSSNCNRKLIGARFFSKGYTATLGPINELKESMYGNCSVEEKEETAVLTVAIVAWGLHNSSRAILLMLILINALKPGFVHAVYMINLISKTFQRKGWVALEILSRNRSAHSFSSNWVKYLKSWFEEISSIICLFFNI